MLPDQRATGFARFSGLQVDIGAYEVFVIPQTLVADTTEDENNGNFGPGDLSLREAVHLANLDPDANTITFSLGEGSQTILLAGTELPLIRTEMTIAGPGADLLTVDAQGGSRIFQVAVGAAKVSISGMTPKRGSTADVGGAIVNSSLLHLSEVAILESTAADFGGAI